MSIGKWKMENGGSQRPLSIFPLPLFGYAHHKFSIFHAEGYRLGLLRGLLMRPSVRCIVALALGLVVSLARPVRASDDQTADMFSLLPPDTERVYDQPQPPREDEGVNNGGVNTEVDVRYLTDDVYRGISHNKAVGVNSRAANFQVQTTLSFNLGKLPHPFVGVFADVDDSDPISRFQEIRPYFGFVYTLRPVIFEVGDNTYIYPERERLNPSPNTAEFYFKFTLDDSYFFLTPQPILSPYIYGAYDYQRNKGWYIETGLKHDFNFEDFGFVLTAYGDVAYISNFAQQFIVVSPEDSGFQHYDLGIIGTLSLNHALQLPPRYGQFSVQGYFTYTNYFANPVYASREIWGGVGLVFKY
jgi:hypothetical protein